MMNAIEKTSAQLISPSSWSALDIAVSVVWCGGHPIPFQQVTRTVCCVWCGVSIPAVVELALLHINIR